MIISALSAAQFGGADATIVTYGGLGQNPAICGLAYATAGASITSASTGANVNVVSYVLPANSLSTPNPNGNSRGLRLTAWGTVANNVNAKTVQITVGNTVLASILITASTANQWFLEANILLYGQFAANTQTVSGLGGQGAVTSTTTATLTQNFATALTFNVQVANQTAGGDVIVQGFMVEVY